MKISNVTILSTDLTDDTAKISFTISEATENVNIYLKINDEEYKEIFWFVDLVNGCVVSVGNHPAGCVVSPYPVDEWFGTFTTKEDKYPISLLNMKEIDSLNFVKLDIRGLTLDQVKMGNMLGMA